MMNDNISIEKLWYDENFYEVQIIMSTEQIRCKVTSSPTCRWGLTNLGKFGSRSIALLC